jgi:uncharacterized protein (TIGR02569 family)
LAALRKTLSDMESPSADILQAFGAIKPPVSIAGGQGQNYRSGNVILKPAQDDKETNWVAEFYLSVAGEGFQLPKPIRSAQGNFVYRGWQAWEFVEGQHERGRWAETIDICVRFHQAVADHPRPAFFERREQNPWVVADQVTWGEMEIAHHPRIAPAVEKLTNCLAVVNEKSQLIHGDFGGNVLFSETPTIIDFSPYWRPVEFAIGVIIADAVVWEGADISLLDMGCKFNNFYQHLARAELRRIIEIEVIHAMYGWEMLDQINAHLPLIDVIVERCH